MSRRPPMRGLERPPRQLYRRPIPDLPRSFELPMYLRVALGQAAADGVPVVASLALAWVRSEPSINLRMPAVRCAEQFEKLFTEHHTAPFGSGMVLPRLEERGVGKGGFSAVRYG